MNYQNIYNQCHEAGMVALNEAVPSPITVTGHGQTFYEMEGLCGFAWISIKPGNSKLANEFKKLGVASKNHYAGGVDVWVREGGQSVTRKEAYASAFAKKLKELTGVERIYAQSRLD